jgi:Tfp pilus assembly protein PilN
MIAMTQQVNLLIDELRPQRALLTWMHALIAAGTVGALLISISLYQWFAIYKAADQRAHLSSQLATLADSNTKARASINVVEDPKLAADVVELRAQLQSRTQLVAALSGSTSGRSAGFAGHLDDLAASTPAGLWLTDIELTDGGASVRLAGMTTDPVLVPRFLKNLGSGAQFVGHRFDTFELAADETGALHFTITGPQSDQQ